MNLIKGFRNISLLDAHQFTENAALVFDQSSILFAGPEQQLPEHFKKSVAFLDLNKAWVTPGLINSHTHVAMSFMRDLAHSVDSMITNLFFPRESALTPLDVEKWSRPSIEGSLASGVTTFIDHYYFSNAVGKALKHYKVRGFIAETLADTGGAKPHTHKLEELVAPQNWRWQKDQLVQSILGPHASDTSSGEYLKKIAQYANQYSIPVHMHLSQTLSERSLILAREKITPVYWVKNLGLLTNRTLAVHLVSADQNDLLALKQQGTYVGLCPSSQVIYEKLAPLKDFHELGLVGALGTDCAASHDSMDLLQELRFLYLSQKGSGFAPDAKEVLKTVWDNPASWLGFPGGKLKENHVSDFCIFRRDLSCEPMQNAHLNFIMSMSSRHLEQSFVSGASVFKRPINLGEFAR